MSPLVTIITPVFNRADVVIDSIKSSLNFLHESGTIGEIIIVDDASSDESSRAISSIFKEQIASGLIRIITLSKNIGPTGAKQLGAIHSLGKWLIFMDSDDLFVAGSSRVACTTLESAPQECPIVFFRCITKSNQILIGPSQDSIFWLNLKLFLHQGTPGECLPAIRRTCLLEVPYSAELRGFESLTYAELIQKFGSACVSPIILRQYCTDEIGNRLSTRKGIKMRGCSIARGYLRMISTFGYELRGHFFSISARIFYHGLNCLLYSIFKKIGVY
jgi:glycosyltransferase involved in cell wall biosynthesis